MIYTRRLPWNCRTDENNRKRFFIPVSIVRRTSITINWFCFIDVRCLHIIIIFEEWIDIADSSNFVFYHINKFIEFCDCPALFFSILYDIYEYDSDSAPKVRFCNVIGRRKGRSLRRKNKRSLRSAKIQHVPEAKEGRKSSRLSSVTNDDIRVCLKNWHGAQNQRFVIRPKHN